MRSLCLVLILVGAVAALAPHIRTQWSQPLLAVTGRHDPDEHDTALDFNVFYAAGDLVRRGEGHDLLRPAALAAEEHANISSRKPEDTLPFLNPPFFALPFALLAALPFWRAFQVWSILNIALLAVTCWLLWDTTRGLSRAARAALLLLMATMLPVAFAMMLGQFSIILMTSWAAAYTLLRRGRDRLAGVALMPLLVKPEMLIPIALLFAWKRRYGVFQALIPAAIVAAALSVAAVGPAEALRYPMYLAEGASRNAAGTHLEGMFGWNGLLDNFGFGAGAETLAALPLALITLGILALNWGGRRSGARAEFAGVWLALTAATILVDPHLYLQDLVILGPAACAFVGSLDAGERPVAGLFIVVGWIILAMGLTPNVIWGVNLFTPYLASMLAVVTVRSLRARSATAGPFTLTGNATASTRVA